MKHSSVQINPSGGYKNPPNLNYSSTLIMEKVVSVVHGILDTFSSTRSTPNSSNSNILSCNTLPLFPWTPSSGGGGGPTTGSPTRRIKKSSRYHHHCDCCEDDSDHAITYFHEDVTTFFRRMGLLITYWLAYTTCLWTQLMSVSSSSASTFVASSAVTRTAGADVTAIQQYPIHYSKNSYYSNMQHHAVPVIVDPVISGSLLLFSLSGFMYQSSYPSSTRIITTAKFYNNNLHKNCSSKREEQFSWSCHTLLLSLFQLATTATCYCGCCCDWLYYHIPDTMVCILLALLSWKQVGAAHSFMVACTLVNALAVMLNSLLLSPSSSQQQQQQMLKQVDTNTECGIMVI